MSVCVFKHQQYVQYAFVSMFGCADDAWTVYLFVALMEVKQKMVKFVFSEEFMEIKSTGSSFITQSLDLTHGVWNLDTTFFV